MKQLPGPLIVHVSPRSLPVSGRVHIQTVACLAGGAARSGGRRY
jgi:hypothetical protein